MINRITSNNCSVLSRSSGFFFRHFSRKELNSLLHLLGSANVGLYGMEWNEMNVNNFGMVSQQLLEYD